MNRGILNGEEDGSIWITNKSENKYFYYRSKWRLKFESKDSLILFSTPRVLIGAMMDCGRAELSCTICHQF
jgi:hypothetical protein